MCCPSVSAFALRPTEAHGGVDLPVEDSSTPRGLRPRRAKARERLPSYREPASFHPQAACCVDRSDLPSTPAPFRLLSIRAPASGGATDFFLASALLLTARPCGRPATKTRDAFNRRLPPKRLACTRTSSVPDSRSPVARRGGPTESWAPHGCFCIGGLDASRRPRPLRRTVIADRTSRPEPHGLEIGSVGVFLPRTACDRASDTPVAYRCHRRASPSFPGAASPGRASLFWRGSRGSDDVRAAEITLHAVS
jgi:hypothetical protein